MRFGDAPAHSLLERRGCATGAGMMVGEERHLRLAPFAANMPA